MIRRDLLLCLAVFAATTSFAQQEKLTQNSFLKHAAFYSYPNESAALKDTREGNPKFIEMSELSYVALNSEKDFTLKLINEPINSGSWSLVSRVNNVKISPDDNVIVFRGVLNLKKHASFREVFLSVGAAASSSRIYLNGVEVGSSSNSKATIEYDITSYLKEGLNSFAIVCFSEGSPIESKGGVGIASTVDVYTKNKVHISDIKYSTTISQGGALALLESQVTLKSHLLNRKPFRLEYKLFSQEGDLINRGFIESDIEMKVVRNFPFLSTIKDPKLWRPGTPYLYTILYSIQQEGRISEVVRQDVGIRTSAIDTVIAVTLTPNLSYTQSQAQAEANMIRSVGVNTVIANTPMNDIYLTACDKAGLYVVDMINVDNSGSGSSLLVGGSLANDPAWLQNHLERVERQIITNGIHTSVVAWQLLGGGANGYNIYEAFLYAKKLDKQRPIINIAADGEWNSDSFEVFQKGIVGAWVVGDMLAVDGGLSEKSYKMMDTQSPVYVRTIDEPKAIFKIINNTADSLASGNLSYKVYANDILIKEGLVECVIEPNSSIEYTIEKHNEIPLAVQLKYSQQLRFGKIFRVEIFKGEVRIK